MREHDCAPDDYAVVIDVIHVSSFIHIQFGSKRVCFSILQSDCSNSLSSTRHGGICRLMAKQVMYAVVWENEDPNFCSAYTAWYGTAVMNHLRINPSYQTGTGHVTTG